MFEDSKNYSIKIIGSKGHFRINVEMNPYLVLKAVKKKE
jgi:hypothetical protein